MSQFEFVTVAVSILLSLTLAQILKAVPHILAPDRRYWVHGVWSVGIVFGALGFWWAVWTYRDTGPWAYGEFVVLLLTPAVMYLSAITLVSDDPGTVASWRDHFFARRVLLFSLLLAVPASVLLRQTVVSGGFETPPLLGAAGPFVVLSVSAMGIAGLVSANQRLHGLLAVGYVATMGFAQLRLLLQPA